MQKKFVLEIEYLFYSYVRTGLSPCVNLPSSKRCGRWRACMAIVIKSKRQFLVLLSCWSSKSNQNKEQARRVFARLFHPTPQSALEVGVEIITWMTHLEEKKSNLVATHDLFT
ncbi:hypothetical protein NC651_007749 [Populus alba x Populus x berolinensis]|nr:hypothetical protein NC651_007749 [Populus alba x Populus x berolinensis]